MGKFRISLGAASCDGYERRSGVERDVCERLITQLETLQRLSVDQLSSLPNERTETIHVEDKQILMTIYKTSLSSGELLLVVQTFLSTWWLPTFFSANGVGKIFVEGIVVQDGKIRRATNQELWAFR